MIGLKVCRRVATIMHLRTLMVSENAFFLVKVVNHCSEKCFVSYPIQQQPTGAGARLAKVNTDAVFDASSETVVLYPENGGNLHCFTALTPCAVLDVMGPPYNRAQGRDCAYYSESPYSCGEFLLLPPATSVSLTLG